MEAVLARSVQVFAALGGAYLVALWFVLIVWAFRDSETRSRSVITQIFSTLLVVLFFIPGALLYLLLRPRQTLDEAFQRSLEEEYLLQDLEELPLCKSCGHYVEDDYVICPNCQTKLRDSCPACARLVDLKWALCPYCGTSQSRITVEVKERLPEPPARWSAPVVLRRRILRQLPQEIETPGELVPGRERPAAIVGAPTPAALAPLRLFDRRKTREASRLNGYRRPVNTNGNGSAVLVDQFGRQLEATESEPIAVGPNGNGSHNGATEAAEKPVAAGSDEE